MNILTNFRQYINFPSTQIQPINISNKTPQIRTTNLQPSHVVVFQPIKIMKSHTRLTLTNIPLPTSQHPPSSFAVGEKCIARFSFLWRQSQMLNFLLSLPRWKKRTRKRSATMTTTTTTRWHCHCFWTIFNKYIIALWGKFMEKLFHNDTARMLCAQMFYFSTLAALSWAHCTMAGDVAWRPGVSAWNSSSLRRWIVG